LRATPVSNRSRAAKLFPEYDTLYDLIAAEVRGAGRQPTRLRLRPLGVE
jgi:hypothetical protein